MITPTAPRLGIAYIPTQPPELFHDIAVAAETFGLDDLWVWEDSFKQSGVASASAALAWTSRITVGIGLMPVPLRNVALTAMEIATLSRMFPSRLIAGIGHGVLDWMGQAGVRAASPMTLLTEYNGALRSLLAGERVTSDGRYLKLSEVQLDWPPTSAPPLMMGGTREKTLRLAGQEADGALLGNAMSDDEVQWSCDVILDAAQGRTDRGAEPFEIVVTLIAATGEGAQQRLDLEVPRWGKPGGIGIGVAGDAARIAETVLRLRDMGITSVVIQPTEDEPDLLGFIRFLGQEVRPLL